MLDVTRLRVIDAVARLGSVTAAAKELHYSQPSVSHHLARLEAETGAQLLQRIGRGIRLTRPGNCWPTERPRSSDGSMPPKPNCPRRWG
jgi:DNA-binding transcriptional LysR family regulator